MALWHFLAYFIFTPCLVAGQQTKYILKGVEVNLNPGISKPPDNILWMHKNNKVVEFNGQEEDVYESFKDRITLNWHTAELRITNPGFDDTGDYVLEAWVDGKTHKSEFNLEVIDEVPKPTISCEMTECSSSNMSATLVCAADVKQSQSLIKFEWSSHGNTQPGSKLTIPLGEENDVEVYTCTVSNPLSVETATFTAKDCHSDCSSEAPIIIPVILVIMLVLVGLGIIMYCKRYNKACFAKAETDDVEKQSKSGATEVSGSPAETESLLKKSTPEGATDSNQDSAEVENKDSQDEKPPKGFVKKMRGTFESPGTKQSPGKPWWKGKSKDQPEETASPSPSQPSEPTSSSDQRKLVRGEEGGSDADQVGREQTEVSQSGKEPDQAEVSASSEADKPETSTSPEQSGKSKDQPEETLSPSPSQQSEPTSSSDQRKLVRGEEGGSDADQLGREQTEVSQSGKEPDQAEVSASSEADKPETSTSPEQSVSEKNKDEETVSPSPSQQNEPNSSSDQNNLSNNDKGDSEADQLGKQETEVPNSDNEAVQSAVLSSSQDTESNQETSTSPEQPACFAKAETDDVEKQSKSGATEGSSSSNKPQHQGGSSLRLDEAVNSHKGATDSDPNSAEVENKDSQDEKPPKGLVEKRRSFYESPGTKQSPGKKCLKELKKETDEDEEKKSPTDGVSPAAPLTQTSKDMTHEETTDEHKGDQVHQETERGSRDFNPSDIGITNESDDSLEKKQSPINSEEKVSEKEEENHEVMEQGMGQSGSAEGNGSQSGGDSKDEDEQPGKQSSTSTAPGENNSSTIEESLEAAQNDEDQKVDAEKMENSQESNKD